MGPDSLVFRAGHVSFVKNRVSFLFGSVISQRFYAGETGKPDHVHLGLFGGPKARGDGLLVVGDVLRAGNGVLGRGGFREYYRQI